jgi:hypothetical protein
MSQRRVSLLPRYCYARVGDVRSGCVPIKSASSRSITTNAYTFQWTRHGNTLTKEKASATRVKLVHVKSKAPKSTKARRTSPTADPLLLKRLITIAQDLRAKQHLDESLLTFKSALGLTDKLFPPDHQRVAEGLENCAALLRLLKREDDRERYLSRAKSIRAKLAGQSSSVRVTRPG